MRCVPPGGRRSDGRVTPAAAGLHAVTVPCSRRAVAAGATVTRHGTPRRSAACAMPPRRPSQPARRVGMTRTTRDRRDPARRGHAAAPAALPRAAVASWPVARGARLRPPSSRSDWPAIVSVSALGRAVGRPARPERARTTWPSPSRRSSTTATARSSWGGSRTSAGASSTTPTSRPLVLDATTTAEDRTFWENAGIDPAALISAVAENASGRRASAAPRPSPSSWSARDSCRRTSSAAPTATCARPRRSSSRCG